MQLHKDDWLSQFFEHGAYTLKPPLSCEDIDLPNAFVSAKVQSEDENILDHLQQKGFQHIETLNTYAQKELVQKQSGKVFDIRFARAADEEQVRQIAGAAFTSSRFYTDPHIANEVASKIKSDWAGNFFKGMRGDKMIITEQDGELTGFLLLIGNVIDLIAVSEQHLQKGKARALIGFANDDVGLLKAGTQAKNGASLALYKACGFELENIQYVLHKYYNEDI